MPQMLVKIASGTHVLVDVGVKRLMADCPGSVPCEAPADLLGTPLLLPYLRPGEGEERGISPVSLPLAGVRMALSGEVAIVPGAVAPRRSSRLTVEG